MTCDSVLTLIPLYSYGELTPAEEDGIEEHLHRCANCAREMERQRSLAAALASRELVPSPPLLANCRADLMAAIQGGAPRALRPPGPWRLFVRALGESLAGFERLRYPAAAAALVALGFVTARLTTNQTQAPAADPVMHTVRSVQPDGAGHVQISYDETRRRTLSGRMDDQNVQQLLLAAAREENPAVRVESVGVLKDNPESSGVRDALLNAVAHDPNAAVRLKAVEGLKPIAGDSDVRKTLAQVLLADDNPAVRMQVVDLLVAHRDDAIVGVLQNLMQKENNSYVRLKSEQALKDMNASIGTF
ncbi:MAG: HEAT repeat domain-containing protein [Acidobacteriia bacterium]|nr:HEAT repeat domain-containing protein [Terriglobia bacterium]